MQSLTQQFLAFCRSKPADEAYDYGAIDNCAFVQFLRETGICDDAHCGGTYWRSAREGLSNLHPFPFDDAMLHAGTFGALTTRLEAALAEQVQA